MIKPRELHRRAEEDEKLYERFGKQFEAGHRGAFVAIARDGQLILDTDQIRAVEKAIEQFGSGNFALRKIGSRALGRWRTRLDH